VFTLLCACQSVMPCNSEANKASGNPIWFNEFCYNYKATV